jgi:hypothetical protein
MGMKPNMAMIFPKSVEKPGSGTGVTNGKASKINTAS